MNEIDLSAQNSTEEDAQALASEAVKNSASADVDSDSDSVSIDVDAEDDFEEFDPTE